MRDSLLFVLGLLDRGDPAFVSAEDLGGTHAPALRFCQAWGFLSEEAEPHPVPSCPFGRAGAALVIASRILCGACHSEITPEHTLRWRFDLRAFLSWLARALRLDGSPRPVDERLWQL